MTADRALPAFGIYATWAHLGEARYPSATSIGVRPSVDGERISVETFIIDFDGDIYDQQLRIELVERLRPEEKFDGLESADPDRPRRRAGASARRCLAADAARRTSLGHSRGLSIRPRNADRIESRRSSGSQPVRPFSVAKKLETGRGGEVSVAASLTEPRRAIFAPQPVRQHD